MGHQGEEDSSREPGTVPGEGEEGKAAAVAVWRRRIRRGRSSSRREETPAASVDERRHWRSHGLDMKVLDTERNSVESLYMKTSEREKTIFMQLEENYIHCFSLSSIRSVSFVDCVSSL